MNTRACPFCGEDVLQVARKCKHCGEFLDDGKSSHARKPAGDTPVVDEAAKMLGQLMALGVSLLMILYACGGMGGDSDKPRGDSSSQIGPDIRDRATALDVWEMVHDYENNQQRAHGKWAGRAVIVTGRLTQGINATALDLNLDADVSAWCSLNKTEYPKVNALNWGDTITLCGRISSGSSTVLYLDDCEIIERR
jgi:hypothetical protein